MAGEGEGEGSLLDDGQVGDGSAGADGDGNGNEGNAGGDQGGDAGGKADDGKGADGGSEGKGDGNGTDGGDAGDQGAPENYEVFTMPEGVEADDKYLETMKPIFKEHNMSQDQAQKFVDAQTTLDVAKEKAADVAQADLMKKWEGELKVDKDFGGDKFDENIATYKKSIKEFGTPELAEMLISTGVANHPDFVKFATKIGNLISEDNFSGGGGSSGGAEKTQAEIIYPADS